MFVHTELCKLETVVPFSQVPQALADKVDKNHIAQHDFLHLLIYPVATGWSEMVTNRMVIFSL